MRKDTKIYLLSIKYIHCYPLKLCSKCKIILKCLDFDFFKNLNWLKIEV